MAVPHIVPLDTGWRLCLTPPDRIETPDGLAGLTDWRPAQVPGTVAGALDRAESFDAHDVWYRLDLDFSGAHTLRCAGLATLAEVWLDDRLLLRSDNMFVSHDIPLILNGSAVLSICFRSLQAHLQKPVRRARWRPRMIKPSTLVALRTTVLGHAESWCPNMPPVGPWRRIDLILADPQWPVDISLRTELSETGGTLHCSVTLEASAQVTLHCAGRSMPMSRDGARHTATLDLPDIEPWWPHTHGHPTLHDVHLTIDNTRIPLGSVGFRSLRIDRGDDGDGFTLVCNDVPIFCRGACWTPVDLQRLPQTAESVEPRLRLAVEAGMNMLRVGGTMLYESPAFYALCDKLGIFVWQDFMFANFDYPAADPAFMASVEEEASQFLHATQASPCIAVLSGGSEVYQQAAMMGLPRDIWRNPIFEELLPHLCAALRPDAATVVNSPSGGVLPFVANQGVSHYYGVGAYMRPLEDARRAGVRFTSECLAFANIAEYPSDWRTVPRDAGADWNFADVRDHYLRLVFGCDPAALRAEDEPRYLEASRAVTAHVMRETLSEWRRRRSPTAGALVWFLSDLAQGAGWGVIDAAGLPKSPYYALKDCQQAVQILATDEGVNGLDLHAINETDRPIAATLRVTCLRDGAVRVADGSVDIALAPRANVSVPTTEILGAFFDTTYAYRFGPPAHDAVVADLLYGERLLSTSVYFPQGLDLARHELGLQVSLEQGDGGWSLVVATQRLATFIQIEDPGFRPAEAWFHLPPGRLRRVALISRSVGTTSPEGIVRALNGHHTIAYGGQS